MLPALNSPGVAQSPCVRDRHHCSRTLFSSFARLHATHPSQPHPPIRQDECNDNEPPPRDRRTFLIATAATATTLLPSLSVLATPTPSLPNTFTSSEGFAFDYPDGWVKAYDRSGGRGNGAVVAVGDFTSFLVVSVFRTSDIPSDIRSKGFSDESSARALCLDVVAAADSTMRFKEIKGDLGRGENGKNVFDFEYEIEICRGEIQEGSGGVLRCLVRFIIFLFCTCITRTHSLFLVLSFFVLHRGAWDR